MFAISWRDASRWWSVRVSAFATILYASALAFPIWPLELWNMMPAEVRAHVPARIGTWISLVLFLLVIIARIAPQKAKDETPARRRGLLASNSGKVTPRAAGMGATVTAMIAAVIAVEGGWVNHPADPGGETNMGITKRVAVDNGYTGPMRQLPRSVAESIYHDRYLVAPGYAPLVSIDAAVAEELFDTTVNMGSVRPSRWFQMEINGACGAQLPIDGRVGASTIAAYKACQPRIGATLLCIVMLDRLDGSQLKEYDRLVARNPKLRVFYKGWVKQRIGNVDRRKCSVGAA